MIHVCYCFHDKTGRYAKFVGTSMLSLFEKTFAPVTVHILHDDTLTPDNRDKILLIAERCNQIVKFYNVAELCADKLNQMVRMVPVVEKSRVSVGSFFKLMIPQIIPRDLDRIIYLDADILFNLDVSELWNIELGDKIFGVVTERANGIGTFPVSRDGFVKPEDYFNSGVLLMNLEALRASEETVTNGVRFLLDNPKYDQFPYQDVLNYCFATSAQKLPVKFNSLVKNWRKVNPEKNAAVWHYAGGRSFGLNMRDAFHKLWMHYFVRTPFLDEDSIGRLYSEMFKMRTTFQTSAAALSAAISGKSRAFFSDLGKIDELRKNFSVRDNELMIIPGENEDSVQSLIDTMKTLKGKYVFFIMTEKFLGKNFPFNRLTDAGFVEGVDFVKGWELLAEDPSTFNANPLVKIL